MEFNTLDHMNLHFNMDYFYMTSEHLFGYFTLMLVAQK